MLGKGFEVGRLGLTHGDAVEDGEEVPVGESGTVYFEGEGARSFE